MANNQILEEQEQINLKVQKFVNLFQPPDELENDNTIRFQIKSWWSVIRANSFKSRNERIDLYERALKCLPGSYKLWYSYIQEMIEELEGKPVLSSRFDKLNELFERALKYLQKMPRIWLMYAEFLIRQKRITKVRENFDKALLNLPVTQHFLIWDPYIQWVQSISSVSTAKFVMKRYICLEPEFKEDFAEYLLNHDDPDGAAFLFYEIFKDEGFASKNRKSKFQIYFDLCALIVENPSRIKSIEVDTLFKQGINKFVDEGGNLWTKLAEYYIKLGKFSAARRIFFEALSQISSVKDFGIVYNAQLKFEEELVNAFAEADDDEIDEEDLEQQIENLDKLVESRPTLLNNVLLRANPLSVKAWIQKFDLNRQNPSKVMEIFEDAVKTIPPLEAEEGSVNELWIKQALYFVEMEDFKSANQIFYKATQIQYRSVEELLTVWITWIETLIELNYFKDAVAVAKKALFQNKKQQIQLEKNEDEPQIISLYNNPKMWSFYVDLEINFGNFETAKMAYKKMVEIKVITPYILLNYAQMLEENNFFEESFKVYETGITLFVWPGVYDVWLQYIAKFVSRYQNQKIERTRDLFEKVLVIVPVEQCKIFYLMYADFEEKYGLLNHAFDIYDRLVANVGAKDKMEAYNIYIAKISSFLGITKSRPIFQNAIEVLKGDEVIQMGLRFAHLERKFGEVDRARAIYIHISQWADPRDDQYELWSIWKDFEVQHGNEDTFKEYLRIQRSVLSKFKLLPPNVERIKQKVENGEL